MATGINKQDQEEIVFRSKLPDIYIPKHLPLHSYCFENVSKFSSRPCLINGATDEIYTYAEVERISKKVGAGLSKVGGIGQGETAMILLHNSPEFVFSFLGASYIGAVSTTVNPYFTSAEVVEQAKASGARLIVTQSSYVEKVRDYAEENQVKIVCIDTPVPIGCIDFWELTSTDESELPMVKINPDDAVALPYSSGTTGVPKGVMLSHKGLITNVAQQVDGENPNFYVHSEDVYLCVLPLYHLYSINCVLLCGLRVGAAILIIQKFDIVQFLELIQKYKVTICHLVPPMILSIVKNPLVVDKYDLSTVRIVMSGAAPLGNELEDALRIKFPNAKLGQGYGMTEGGPVLALCLAFAKEPSDIKSGASGTVLRNTEMKIVDTETGASLPKNHPGEIWVRGDQVMKGYLSNLEATGNNVDKDGWLHTGDIGLIDDDDELFVVDRLKEIIKYKSFQVAPSEIEAILVNHPCISDAAVVPMKDEQAGEVPVAFVVKSNTSNITEDEIKQFVSKQVMFYKRISQVFFVEAIPKVPSGKILRRNLTARLASN